MVRRMIIGGILAVVAGACVAFAVPPAPKRDITLSVPHIARILGIEVGLTTVESLEKRIGPGAPCMGGHPHGGRVWFIKPYYCWVYVDGFEYSSKGGRIIDTVNVSLTKKDYDFDYERPKPLIPQVSAGSTRTMGWLNCVMPGMTRQQVEKLVASLPKPTPNEDTLVWSVKGTQRVTDEVHPTRWTARLEFHKDKLMSISVEGGRALWEYGD